MKLERTLALGFGLLEAIAPNRIVDVGERLAFENPEVGRLRPWTIPVARLEGVAFVWLLGRDAKVSPAVKVLLASFGVCLALVPRTVVERALDLAYENADDLEVKAWVLPATRLLGVGYVIVGLLPMPVDGPSDSTGERREK